MQILESVGLIAADTPRSRAYVQAMEQSGLFAGHTLVLRDPEKKLRPGQQADANQEPPKDMGGFVYSAAEPLETTLERIGATFEYVDSIDINSDLIFEKLRQRPEEVFIYSGFGGGILRQRILETKRFLHVHGGYLPAYKGSTTNYFSLIQEGFCGTSTIFLEPEIDCGAILVRQKFDPPEDRQEMDFTYESAIRALTLTDTLKAFAKTGAWPDSGVTNAGGDTYYIIHPLLKHLAILGA